MVTLKQRSEEKNEKAMQVRTGTQVKKGQSGTASRQREAWLGQKTCSGQSKRGQAGRGEARLQRASSRNPVFVPHPTCSEILPFPRQT